MLTLPLLGQEIRTRTQGGKRQIWDFIRRQWLVLTPEEHVRQLLIGHLSIAHQYPTALMAVEKTVRVGAGLQQRFDLVVHARDTHLPWMIAECKAPDVPITDAALHQLLRYQSVLQCRYWLLTNGHQHYCADAGDTQQITWLNELPAYNF